MSFSLVIIRTENIGRNYSKFSRTLTRSSFLTTVSVTFQKKTFLKRAFTDIENMTNCYCNISANNSSFMNTFITSENTRKTQSHRKSNDRKSILRRDFVLTIC